MLLFFREIVFIAPVVVLMMFYLICENSNLGEKMMSFCEKLHVCEIMKNKVFKILKCHFGPCTIFYSKCYCSTLAIDHAVCCVSGKPMHEARDGGQGWRSRSGPPSRAECMGFPDTQQNKVINCSSTSLISN